LEIIYDKFRFETFMTNKITTVMLKVTSFKFQDKNSTKKYQRMRIREYWRETRIILVEMERKDIFA